MAGVDEGRKGERHRNQGHLENLLSFLRDNRYSALEQKLLEVWEAAMTLAQTDQAKRLDEARIDRVAGRLDQILAATDERTAAERDRLRDWLSRFCRELRLATREAGHQGVEPKTRTRLKHLLKQGGRPGDRFAPEREPRALKALLEDLVA